MHQCAPASVRACVCARLRASTRRAPVMRLRALQAENYVKARRVSVGPATAADNSDPSSRGRSCGSFEPITSCASRVAAASP
eukprot:5354042-Pleurochrysis_carterae.AAC.2